VFGAAFGAAGGDRVRDPTVGRTSTVGRRDRMAASRHRGLHGKGLRFYAAHEVRNSLWLEEHIRVNSVHPQHSDAAAVEPCCVRRAGRHGRVMPRESEMCLDARAALAAPEQAGPRIGSGWLLGEGWGVLG
jgi:hypothetical protein